MQSVRSLVLLLLSVAAVIGCGSGSKRVGAGRDCALNTDCDSPLVCKFMKCHHACNDSPDCDRGLRCVKVDGIGVCQLPPEADFVCGASVACSDPLVCGPDRKCRNSCKVKADCIGMQTCVTDAPSGKSVCADPSETLTPADGGATGGTDGGTGGTGGSGNGTGGAGGTPDAGAGDVSDGNDSGVPADGQSDTQGDASDAPDVSPEVAACGALGQSCCAGTSCSDGLSCLNGVSCSCAKTLFGRYLLRTDGKLLYQADPPSTAQTPVLDAATGLPLADVTGAAEGFQHGCAVLGAAKTAWCWRTAATGNQAGQLGNGTTDSGPLFRATPVLTGPNQPLTNVKTISSSGSSLNPGTNTCAITTDGKLYCWGNLRWLANDGVAPLRSPYAVPITTDGVTPFTGVVQVGLGATIWESRNDDPFYACAVVQGASSREVWCWGQNYLGNLATGDTGPRQFPTKVVGLTNPSEVIPWGENGTVCALDGMNLRCWGANNQGQVGNGSTNSPVLAPTIVTLMGGATALGQIVDVRGGSDGSRDDVCALSTDHTAKCWGFDFQTSPTNFAVTNIVALGNIDAGAVRVLTSDGTYRIAYISVGSNLAGTVVTRAPNCGLLQ